jgi:hypothetical protein
MRHIASTNESSEQPTQGKKWRRTTIKRLSEDTLLEIFDFYRLDEKSWLLLWERQRPWKWHRLAHVCQKWRHVIFTSPRRLDLRILCNSGAPVRSILKSWPTLPLVVRFHASRTSESMPRNVMVALRYPDRLCEIDLDVTSSMTGSIVESIQKPCQALESIRITVKDATGPSILARNAFLGGSAPHLRKVKLDGIAFPFPEIRQVLLSTNNLVELHLSNIPDDVYFSPDDLVTGLFILVQLKRLTVGFHSPTSRPPPSMTRPPFQRTTLPSLTFLDFHGASEYLEEFVARIDFPALCDVTIRLFNQIFFEIPQFCQFIPRLIALRPPAWVVVTHSVESVSVLFVREGKPSNENCFLGTSCRRLDWQLSFVTQISSQLSPLVSSVCSLNIKTGHEFPSGEEDVDSTQWLELFQPFTHVTQVYVGEKRIVPGIVRALVADDMAAGVLPELTKLHLEGYRSSPSVATATEQFVATRRLSGRRVHLTD